MKDKFSLVIFGEELPHNWSHLRSTVEVVVAKESLKSAIESAGLKFTSLESLIEPGSIYEASVFAEELSQLKLLDGSIVSKSFTYKSYELWWMNYDSLYLHFCLPYTQYKRLLNYLKDFQNIYIYEPPYKNLFSCYLRAYGRDLKIISNSNLKSFSFLPFGIFVQIILTFIFLPILIIKKRRLMVFVGDKFEKTKDYDFRMKFIYEELRQRKIPFVEFIRSLESWKTVIEHAFFRKRPVIYSEAVVFVGKFLSFISGGHIRAKRKFGSQSFGEIKDGELRFKLSLATNSLLKAYDNVWSIRIMKLILRAIGIKVAYITSATERNFHAFLGCRLNNISTIGILHGFASRYYNGYDFLPTYNGKNSIQVDKYGVWSKWWKEYYLKNSKVYTEEQLFISGPMRPILREDINLENIKIKEERKNLDGKTKVLFISEQLATPSEIMPYLKILLDWKDIDLTIKFRPYRDGFEEWLLKNEPQILKGKDIKIVRGTMQEAIQEVDVVVGSHSTAVIEALFQYKASILFYTQKWGDYFELKDYGNNHPFFATNKDELVNRIKEVRSVSGGDLGKLLERFFGDPYQNGSKWVVDQLEEVLLKGCITK